MTTGDMDLFFIPWVLVGRETFDGMKYYHSPRVLEELVLAIKDGRIDKIQLDWKGWEVREFDIPDIYVRSFIDACSKKGKKNNRRIEKFSEEIYETILSLVEEVGYIDDDYDEEDYADDWWKRGDDMQWE